MARLILAALVIIIPAVLAAPSEKSEKKGRQYISQGPGQAVTGSGAIGLDYGQTQASNENHDKKNFGVSFSSDKGSSNNFSQTGLQAAAAGGLAQAQVPQYAPVQYPVYPYHYPQYYPSYQYPSYYPQYAPVYPGAGVPTLGVGSNVNLPGGVSAGSVGAVQGGIRGPVVQGGIRAPAGVPSLGVGTNYRIPSEYETERVVEPFGVGSSANSKLPYKGSHSSAVLRY